MLGGWVNPHREQQTIPQGQTSKPAQIFPHANGQSAPGKAALATFAGAPGATHRARPRSPSRKFVHTYIHTYERQEIRTFAYGALGEPGPSLGLYKIFVHSKAVLH